MTGNVNDEDCGVTDPAVTQHGKLMQVSGLQLSSKIHQVTAHKHVQSRPYFCLSFVPKLYASANQYCISKNRKGRIEPRFVLQQRYAIPWVAV